jgi:HEAT repeat protein
MRGSVVVALGHIRAKKARRALVGCLQDEDPAVRWYAARGLAEIGEVENVVPLQALLKDDVVLFDRSVGEVAESAIVAIERRGGSPWHWLRKQVHVVGQMLVEKTERG